MKRSHYFIALSIPNSIKDILAKWQSELRIFLPYRQWTHPDDLHITLKFLGEVNDNKLIELNQLLKSLTSHSSFLVTIASIGFFGESNRPRVLWAGVNTISSLFFIQKEIEMLTNKVGFPKEKRSYYPHITLAKKWDGHPNKEQLEENRLAYQNKRLEFLGTEIKLYKIHPTKKIKYEAIYTYPLRRENHYGPTN